MRRWIILLLSFVTVVATYACGGAQQPPDTSLLGETCPVLDAGPPPTCPKECKWDPLKKQCRQDLGATMVDLHDAGTPPPNPPAESH